MNQDPAFKFVGLLPRIFPQWLVMLGLVGLFTVGFVLGLLYGRLLALAQSFQQRQPRASVERLEQEPALAAVPVFSSSYADRRRLDGGIKRMSRE